MELLFLLIMHTGGNLIPLNVDNLCNTGNVVGFSAHHEVALADNGRGVAVWEPTNGPTIKYRLIDDEGQNFFAEKDAFTPASGVSYQDPDVAMDADGDFVIVATQFDNNASTADIVGQRFDNLGNKVGTIFKINNEGMSEAAQRNASIAMYGNGDFFVTWVHEAGIGNPDVRYTIYINNDDLGFFPFLMNPVTLAGNGFPEDFPVVAVTTGVSSPSPPTPAAVIAYVSGNSPSDVVVAPITNGGVVTAGPFFASATSPTVDRTFPDVGMDGSGNMVAGWRENNSFYFRRFDNAGNALDATDQDVGFSSGRIAMDKDGDFTIAFLIGSSGSFNEYESDGTQTATLREISALPFTVPRGVSAAVSRDGSRALMGYETVFVSDDGGIFTRMFLRLNDDTDTDGDGISDIFEILNDSKPNEALSRPAILDMNSDGVVNSLDAIHWYRHLVGGAPVIVPEVD